MSVQGGKADRCYLTGEIQIRTENHPKGIIAANHSHILSFKLSNNWTVVTTTVQFFISVHVIRVGIRLLIQR